MNTSVKLHVPREYYHDREGAIILAAQSRTPDYYQIDVSHTIIWAHGLPDMPIIIAWRPTGQDTFLVPGTNVHRNWFDTTRRAKTHAGYTLVYLVQAGTYQNHWAYADITERDAERLVYGLATTAQIMADE
jgi:hypothetical protein